MDSSSTINDRSRLNLSVGYGELPTAPVLMSSHRTPTRQGTPTADRRSMMADTRGSSVDMANFDMNKSSTRYPGQDGFRFPKSFVPANGNQINQSQFFTDLMPQSLDISSEASTPRVLSGHGSRTGSRNAGTCPTSATVISIESVPQTPLSEQEPDRPLIRTDALADEEAESPFEPNLSDESLTPYESNQSTVTSLAQLIRQSAKIKDDQNDLNE